MLVRESQGFNLEKVGLAQQTIDVNTQGMGGELGIEPSA